MAMFDRANDCDDEPWRILQCSSIFTFISLWRCPHPLQELTAHLNDPGDPGDVEEMWGVVPTVLHLVCSEGDFNTLPIRQMIDSLPPHIEVQQISPARPALIPLVGIVPVDDNDQLEGEVVYFLEELPLADGSFRYLGHIGYYFDPKILEFAYDPRTRTVLFACSRGYIRFPRSKDGIECSDAFDAIFRTMPEGFHLNIVDSDALYPWNINQRQFRNI